MSDAGGNSKAAKTETVRKAECSRCGGLRNCDVRGRYLELGGDEHFQWHVDWMILQCRGCEHVFALTVATNSEDWNGYYEQDGSTGTEYVETLHYWPALSKRKRPDWLPEGGMEAEGAEPLEEAMRELYGALNADLTMLAAIGIRTCFDVASELLGTDSNLSFEKKLSSLVAAGKIGVVDKDRLGILVEAGNASAHRGWRPTAAELATMVEILEHFVDHAFVAPFRQKKLDEEAAKVKSAVPARRLRAKKSKADDPTT